ncbi:MAG: hypothetical protein IH823_06290, partial [Candidatus Dadabacteria bacterium]|nr:hypothetical protein [Candidatus Dadabacteria bacterium]
MTEKINPIFCINFQYLFKKYIDKNPTVLDLYNLDHLDSLSTESTKKKITQWRLATMGRLSELKIVNWTINEKGDS